MNIKEMHYDYKQKLNKIDSQQYRNLRIPEIDWKLNEAIELFIKLIAQPRMKTHLGFEISQRSIDDIRTVVVNDSPCAITPIAGTDDFLAALPTDYQHFVSVQEVVVTEPGVALGAGCDYVMEKIYVRQHDDDFQSSPFDKSSLLWREVNITFYESGIRLYTGGEFDVQSLSLNYIRRHPFVHNAEDYSGATYTDLTGTALTGTQDCILPGQTHREVVDLAVLITTGDLQIPDYQVKRNKLSFNQI